MTATREILNGLNQPRAATLAHVTPTKSLLITPMPCEETCAVIRNTTVNSMKVGNTANVAYRYIQNNAGATNTLFEAAFYGAIALININSLITKPDDVFAASASGIGLLMNMANILPNISNTIRYRETRDACAEWLESRLSPEKIEKIKSLKYNQKGINTLVDLMRDEHVDLTFIENKAKKIDEPLSCWQLDR